MRPAVVVSNDVGNSAVARLGRGTISVVPLTSNVARIGGFDAPIEPGASGLSEPSKAQANLVTTIDVGRVLMVLGRVSSEELAGLDHALAVHLGLELA